ADRDNYSARLSARYGVTNRLEAELTGSYVYRDDATRSREFLTGAVADSIYKAQGQGLGDLELGLRYQFRRRSPTSPFMVGNLRIKSATGSDPFEISAMSSLAGQPKFSTELPTGSGFWSINPSLTFMYPTDPVVFFGNVGYLWTIEDDNGTYLDADGNVRGFGRVDPGDAYRMSFGLGLGLNETSSFSISYSLDQFTKTRIQTAIDPKIAGSDVTVGRLNIGYSLRLSDGTPLNLAVGIGTTDDAPDTDLTLRMPFSFGE
ncbi:MAG: transporter, partial [Gammaproteobacteria bacterium]|nr:transporter [Gammaproteobacteria bacterium]